MDKEKRRRLVSAAKALFYHQGFHRTTIAEIAAKAEVPLGNVYYYFKTKDALCAAVISEHVSDLEAAFVALTSEPDARQRLIRFVRSSETFAEQLVQSGCPHGSLAQELDKDSDVPARDPSSMLRTYLGWAESQFQSLGADNSEDLAVDLIGALQGTFLLTNGLRSPDLLTRKIGRLTDWLANVA